MKNIRAIRVQARDANLILVSPKRSQVTIFVIVAIILVVGVVTYFLLRTGYTETVPADFKPVYDHYVQCLQDNAQQGIDLMGVQAGWLYPPEFSAGSQYMPFSSQLDFFGQGVPYWLYVSGNNILKEQVPTKSDMQSQLEKFISERVSLCNFDNFMENVNISDNPEVVATISDNKVDFTINNRITISSENQTASVSQTKFSITSKLGKFYQFALDIYNYEKGQMFLEKYALDVLQLYAPVTGVDLSCAPKVFSDEVISQNLTDGLTRNIQMLKLKGNYYTLSQEQNKYYVTDIGQQVDEQVNFIYSPQWPKRIEIYGDKVVQPVGPQEGLGILGFCYVPYHLVYDIDFPVLIQLYDNKEVFQFPMAVVIDKNQARNALPGEAGQVIDSQVCNYPDYPVTVNTYDSSLNPLAASLRFKCLNTECPVGDTNSNGVFSGKMPACVNGFIMAHTDGYADSKYQISTNEETEANIILNKLYNVTLDLGKVDSAIVYFNSPDYSTTAMYPDTRNVQLIEGDYNITVYVFKNSSIKLNEVSQQKCVNVPQSSFGGLIGLTDEKCFDITIPAQDITMAVVGGGKTEDYITEGQLKDAKKLNINVPLFKTPTTLDDVQKNYIALDSSRLQVEVIK